MCRGITETDVGTVIAAKLDEAGTNAICSACIGSQ